MAERVKFLVSVREGARNFPLLLQKPALLRLWLITARRAYIGLGVVLVLMTLAAPPAASFLANTIYPEKLVAEPVFYFVKSYRFVSNPRGDQLYLQLLMGSWAIGLAVVAGLFLGQIPNAIALGKDRAEFLLAKAARLSESAPEDSMRSRLMAENLLVEGGEVTVLGERIVSTLPIGGIPSGKTNFIGDHDRYRLDRVAGGGGMGTVYAGYDTVLQRLVAIKQLFRHVVIDVQQLGRFRREGLALAKLNHNHIVPIYDLFDDAQSFWLVMELLTGGSLDERIKEQQKLSVADSVAITTCIAQALEFAHSKGFVHRDVKPMNILFSADGTPKLTDFGAVKLERSSFHTQEGMVVGSPGYLSPEQANGAPVDNRSDIYSLGISLYQMLTGRVPFEGDTSSILAQHLTKAPRPPRELNKNIPGQLESVILIMLEKKPESRYQSIGEFMTALCYAAPANPELALG